MYYDGLSERVYGTLTSKLTNEDGSLTRGGGTSNRTGF